MSGAFAATVVLLHMPHRVWAIKMCVFGVAFSAVLLLYTVLAANGVTHETRSQAAAVLGWITLFMTITQFGAPLATMRRVLATKLSASLPLFICIMNTANSSSWSAYSAVKWNPHILAPCIIGAIMSVTQVVLWVLPRQNGSRLKPLGGSVSS
jgi:solute carrier family 50 protein (sugar transporter)